MPAMLPVPDLGYAEPFRVWHFLEQDFRAGWLLLESSTASRTMLSMMLWPQDHADLLAVGEMFGQSQRVGDTALAFLVGAIQLFPRKFPAVGQLPAGVFR